MFLSGPEFILFVRLSNQELLYNTLFMHVYVAILKTRNLVVASDISYL